MDRSEPAGKRGGLAVNGRAGIAAGLIVLAIPLALGGLSGARAQGSRGTDDARPAEAAQTPGQGAGQGGAAAGTPGPTDRSGPAVAASGMRDGAQAMPAGAGAGAVEVDPSEVTADSLISRHQSAPRDPNKGPVTNLPLPRYVSLKGGEGNARRGPSLSHRIDWVFRHPGMPLRVVAEFGHWRRVEDQDGAGGWVHYSLLSGVRTAIITTDMAELRASADPNGSTIARAEAGAIVRLHECVKDWCRVSGDGEKGWVVKTSLWGADADEIRE